MLDELYSELLRSLTASRLKEISIAVIDGYREKDHAYLKRLARSVGMDPSHEDAGRLFGRIIQVFHPDKINRIKKDIEEHYRNADAGALKRMKDLYLSDSFRELRSAAGAPVRDDDYVFEEDEYGYGEDDFGYDEEATGDDGYYPDEEYPEEEDIGADQVEAGIDGKYSFIDAVTHHFVGNLDYRLTAEDLRNLDGELDLSGCDIDDLAGVEYCIHVSALNLSGNNIMKIGALGRLANLYSLFISENRIEDISGLRGLSGLRELDISFNRVEDISPLLGLGSLEYLNIVNNPVRDKKIIDELIARGVMVIY